MRRLRAAATSALLLALAACAPDGNTSAANEPVAGPSGTNVAAAYAPQAGGGPALHAVLHISPAMYEPEDPPPGKWVDTTPRLSTQAAALARSWGEPRRTKEDGLTVWTWEGEGNSWTLRLRGWPFVSDRDDAITVTGDSSFELIAQIDGTVTRIAADCRQDTEHSELSGALRGQAASPEELQKELAGLLPIISAHLGLQADERIERAVQDKGVRAGLGQIARLTSSTARLAGYATLLREADEPSNSELAAVLRQAATDLPVDTDMRELLLEIGSFTFDDRATSGPLLAAAATIQDDAIQAEVLGDMINLTDKMPPTLLAKILRTAADDIEDDEALLTVLQEAAWQSASSSAARAAWLEALDTIEADGPLAQAVEAVLSLGDVPPDECLVVVRSAARIGSEPLRAQALRSIEIDELSNADVADAYVEALQALRDQDVLADMLVDLLKRSPSPARLTVRWLAVAQPLAPGTRMPAVLAAVPRAHLADPAVKALYQSLAESLDSSQQRQQALDRLKLDPPTTKPSAPR